MAGGASVAAEPATVLVAEDDKFDRLIPKRASKATGLGVAVRSVEHGEELLGHLDGCVGAGAGAGGRPPAVVFLDLNMPLLDGRGVVRRMRAEPALRGAPVVAMSTLTKPDEVAEVLSLGANGHFAKPAPFAEFVAQVRASAAPWLEGRSPAAAPGAR